MSKDKLVELDTDEDVSKNVSYPGSKTSAATDYTCFGYLESFDNAVMTTLGAVTIAAITALAF